MNASTCLSCGLLAVVLGLYTPPTPVHTLSEMESWQIHGGANNTCVEEYAACSDDAPEWASMCFYGDINSCDTSFEEHSGEAGMWFRCKLAPGSGLNCERATSEICYLRRTCEYVAEEGGNLGACQVKDDGDNTLDPDEYSIRLLASSCFDITGNPCPGN